MKIIAVPENSSSLDTVRTERTLAQNHFFSEMNPDYLLPQKNLCFHSVYPKIHS